MFKHTIINLDINILNWILQISAYYHDSIQYKTSFIFYLFSVVHNLHHMFLNKERVRLLFVIEVDEVSIILVEV